MQQTSPFSINIAELLAEVLELLPLFRNKTVQVPAEKNFAINIKQKIQIILSIFNNG
jgi:hypothetical protein